MACLAHCLLPVAAGALLLMVNVAINLLRFVIREAKLSGRSSGREGNSVYPWFVCLFSFLLSLLELLPWDILLTCSRKLGAAWRGGEGPGRCEPGQKGRERERETLPVAQWLLYQHLGEEDLS